jgi:hypothetical protein
MTRDSTLCALAAWLYMQASIAITPVNPNRHRFIPLIA